MKSILLLFLTMNAVAVVAAPSHYTITDLGYGDPYAINNAGLIVGTDADYYVPGGKGVMYGINDNGQSVGWLSMGVVDQRAISNAHLWDSSGVHNLAPFPYPSYARDINDSGVIVGFGYPYDWGNFYPIVWDVNGMRVLTEVGTTGVANAINNSGQIAGTGNGGTSAWILDQNGIRFLPKPPEMWAVQAYAISENGYVAGLTRFVDPNRGTMDRACYWDADGWHDIGWLDGLYQNSFATGINSSMQIVGSSGSTATSQSHAFLWQESMLYDLNTLIDPTSGWELLEARAINHRGQIAVKGWNGQGAPHALLLTPVPEPSSVLGVVAGIVLLLRRKATVS
ncbi:MAG: PEP-CTERM sorting domain-containing protein [Armatimonadota bacterium]